ncbi:RedY protein [Streptomyces albus]|uniref:RedY protein n=1 Tax=Streptomyces albus TaxID=1888 RepID=A0A6C1BXD9_9ACTN|nr:MULTISPECIES: hypothetical protein [Streptomyces]KPC93366.1 RedY protein [Streptomyces sp. NRRL F-6602]WVH45037.1 hypothetical protein [Streptomyces sp.]EPD96577.1 hypothetical protein HMPREF1486_00752 [Streptomyces sp. HPH0547]MDI6411245.1 RedY protein [Streptomyces albus]QID35233.1 RedY protein [Streptomyces albus]
MECVVHRIRLREAAEHERFEKWVREVDYAACPQLPSVVSFSVHRVSLAADAPVHYFEVIQVTSQAAFAADAAGDVFRGLEAEFGTMAEVVDELAGERVGAGYAAG